MITSIKFRVKIKQGFVSIKISFGEKKQFPYSFYVDIEIKNIKSYNGSNDKTLVLKNVRYSVLINNKIFYIIVICILFNEQYIVLIHEFKYGDMIITVWINVKYAFNN
jgi:hypothetical protein